MFKRSNKIVVNNNNRKFFIFLFSNDEKLIKKIAKIASITKLVLIC